MNILLWLLVITLMIPLALLAIAALWAVFGSAALAVLWSVSPIIVIVLVLVVVIKRLCK